MRVIEATANTVEAIRKAWELRHDLTDTGNSRNYSLAAGKRSQNPGYSGEFKVSVYNVVRNSEEEENPGEITSLELSVCNGLYEGYDNAYPYAGWVMLIGNRVYHVPALDRSSYIKGETSLRLSNFCIWLRVVFGSRVATEYIFTDEDEQPKNKSEVYMSVYHLLAIVRDGKVFQAQYGAIYITDRYYDVDEADTE